MSDETSADTGADTSSEPRSFSTDEAGMRQAADAIRQQREQQPPAPHDPATEPTLADQRADPTPDKFMPLDPKTGRQWTMEERPEGFNARHASRVLSEAREQADRQRAELHQQLMGEQQAETEQQPSVEEIDEAEKQRRAQFERDFQLETERQQLLNARQQYEAALPQLAAILHQQAAGEFSDIKSMADLEKLAQEDAPRFLRFQLARDKLAAVVNEVATAQQRQQHDQVQAFNNWAQLENLKFEEKHPEFSDPATAAPAQAAALSYLESAGFTKAGLQAAWYGQPISLRDHRVQSVIMDAMRWRAAQDKMRDLGHHAKAIPPVARPGNGAVRGANETVAALTTRLRQASGKRNSIDLATQLMQARRQARGRGR